MMTSKADQLSTKSHMTWAALFARPFLEAKFDQVGFGLKFKPGTLSVSPIVTVMTTSLNTGPAMAVGTEFSFSGRIYAIWPCQLGMTALFWADIKIVLKDMFEADINVFASYFCGVKTGKLMHFVASLPLNKKIKIADMFVVTNLHINASVHMDAGVVAGVKGTITGNIDITLPALTNNGGDISIAGFVTFDTVEHEYSFIVDEFVFTHSLMTMTASGMLAISEELSYLEFDGSAMIMVPGIMAFEASIPYGLLMIKQPKELAMFPTFEIDFILKSMEIPGGVYVEDASFHVEVFVDAAGAVSMRADLNGTIGLSHSLPAALGDFGVTAHLETKIIMDDKGLSIDGDIKAGGSLRTGTRPTLNRRTEPALLCERSP
jgi:hypothetical protein